jgi:hypothetical protein
MTIDNFETNAVAYEVFVSSVRSPEGKQLAISANAEESDVVVCVRFASGSDLQAWERREVKTPWAGTFVLVNKQRSNKCIARRDTRNGSALYLADVSEIGKNQLCLWRNEGNLRGFHPINSGVDWEQKINIPGNGPYRDGQALCTWEWSGGAGNEMWAQLNGSFDVAAGADVETVNALSSSVFSGTYPKVFKGALSVGQLGIESVSYDIEKAPRFMLRPSVMVADSFRENCCAGLSAEHLELAALEAAQASFEATFEPVSVTVNFKDQAKLGPVSGVVRASALAEVLTDNSLTIRLVSGQISIPNVPAPILDALNKAFVPLLIDYLNRTVLSPIKIPAISFLGISFTKPEVITLPDTLLAFSAMQPSPLLIPPPSPWPSKAAFVCTDALALNEVANRALDQLKIGGGWDWGCDIGICDLKLHAGYSVRLLNASFNLKPGSGNRITGSVSFDGRANFEGKCGFFNPDFKARITGSGTVTAAVVVRNQKIYVIFESLDDINLTINLFDLPSYLSPLTFVLTALINAFSPVVSGAITSALRGTDFEVYKIPTISFSITDIPFEVTLKDLALSTISGPGSIPLLTVTGLADVRSPRYKLTITHSLFGKVYTPEEVEAPEMEVAAV